MHIHSVTISNFRSFGPVPETIQLGPDVSALIGANGSGKSAFLAGLQKLFGATREERAFTTSDFHVQPREHLERCKRKEAMIEVVLAFPELTSTDKKIRATAERTVPIA